MLYAKIEQAWRPASGGTRQEGRKAKCKCVAMGAKTNGIRSYNGMDGMENHFATHATAHAKP